MELVLLFTIIALVLMIGFLLYQHGRERDLWTQAMMSRTPQDYQDIRRIEKQPKKKEYVDPKPDLTMETELPMEDWEKFILDKAKQ